MNILGYNINEKMNPIEKKGIKKKSKIVPDPVRHRPNKKRPSATCLPGNGNNIKEASEIRYSEPSPSCSFQRTEVKTPVYRQNQELCNKVEKMEISNSKESKRTRRFSDTLENNKIHFTISSVRCHDSGRVFHSKSSQCDVINLKLYLQNKSSNVLKSKRCVVYKILEYNRTLFQLIKNRKLNAAKAKSKSKFSKKQVKARTFTAEDLPDEELDYPAFVPLKSRIFTSNKLSDNSETEQDFQTVESACKIILAKEDCSPSLTASPSKGSSEKKLKLKKNKKQENVSDSDNYYSDYLEEDFVLAGLEDGTLVKGVIRINAKNTHNAYVSNGDMRQTDYLLNNLGDFNRALEGDEVVLQIKAEDEWVNGQKTAQVVYILKKNHPRSAVGNLQLLQRSGKAAVEVQFIPRDKRFPQMLIPPMFWPQGFREDPDCFTKNLYLGHIISWDKKKRPSGMIGETIGCVGDYQAEARAIVEECGLDIRPFTENARKFILPPTTKIPEEEFEYREDFRDRCVFTIDPLTARDLDDAVSCRELPNGNYEIGVHISDASFYLKEGTDLDLEVSRNATTTYLINQTYHMLPIELCLMCSLLPGQDKLSFSVVWEMTKEAEVVSTRFTRSVINSCCQLAYEHAQEMIENPAGPFSGFPEIVNGYTVEDLSRIVNTLNKLAVIMRKQRFDNGALKIDQIKLSFVLDPETRDPIDWKRQEIKDANKLIEEFMLLANMSVAREISDHFPKLAFLRCHEPPKQRMLTELQRTLETFGMFINTSSSISIRESLNKYCTNDLAGQCRELVLNHLLTKPMVRARYFCQGDPFEEHGTHHYALNADIYTHFTSPIRRYADIMVHRLLAGCLNYTERPNWTVTFISEVATNCNIKKHAAKRAGEMSTEFYFTKYLEKVQPLHAQAVVIEVREKFCDLMLMGSGFVFRMRETQYHNPNRNMSILKESMIIRNDEESEDVSERKLWRHVVMLPKKKQPVVIEIFSVIHVSLKVDKKKKRIYASLDYSKYF